MRIIKGIFLLTIIIIPSVCAATTTPVIIVPGMLGSVQHNGQWVIDPILHVYDDLIRTLGAVGYVASSTLFTFPYDWRRSNNETARLLKEKIAAVKNSCACSSVDIVGHSMGGLVARAYVQSDEYAQDVRRLVFLGTPHQGVPAAYFAWQAGEIKPDGIASWILELMLSHQAKENGYSNISSYINGYPIRSIEELLPIYDAYKFPGDDSSGFYREDYSHNYFLSALGALNINVYGQSNPDGIWIRNIYSDSDDRTIGTIDIPSPGAYPTGVSYLKGDGTVPSVSAQMSRFSDISIDSSHIDLPTKSEDEVLDALSADTVVLNSQPEPPSKQIVFYTSERTRDFAQSFTVPYQTKLTDIYLYLRKAEASSYGLNVLVVDDQDGVPGNNVIASSVASSALMSGSRYFWIDAGFPRGPVLSPGSTYWIVVERTREIPRFSPDERYAVAANANTFPSGEARIGNWADGVWFTTSPEGLSAYFKVVGVRQASLVGSIVRRARKIFAVMAFSPIDMMVTAPDGKRVGRDPVTGQEVNEIPDAFYSGSGSDEEYVTISDPLDGEYRIDTVGTGVGDFSVQVASITDSGRATTTLTGVTAEGATSTFSVDVTDESVQKSPPPQIVEPVPFEESAVSPPVTSNVSVKSNTAPSTISSATFFKSFEVATRTEAALFERSVAPFDVEAFIRAYKAWRPERKPPAMGSARHPEKNIASSTNGASVYVGFSGVFHKISALARQLVRSLW